MQHSLEHYLLKMIAERFPALSALSPDEKILLAAELWKEVVSDHGESPDPGVVEALRERLAYHKEHPHRVSSWDEVRSKFR